MLGRTFLVEYPQRFTYQEQTLSILKIHTTLIIHAIEFNL
jgi:hypothetical protein